MIRFLKLLVIVPIAALILAFAIANRQIVPVSFDPFSDPGASSALLAAPLFILLFLTLILGTFVGGIAAWLSQGANRRRLREARDDAERWRAEARRLREQPPMVVPANARPPAGPSSPSPFAPALAGPNR